MAPVWIVLEHVLKHWNLPHLALLAALAPYLLMTADWASGPRLAVGTLSALLWLIGAERWWPHRVEWHPTGHDWARDAGFLGLGALVDSLGAAAIAALTVAGPFTHAAQSWPLWLALPLAALLGELGPWALHRWAHRGGWMWQLHALHHRPHALNTANAVLVHPINLLWNQAARALPWWLLGFDPQVVVAAALFLQVQSLAVHANVAGGLGPFGGWLGHAQLHRWHHSPDQLEAQNFGTALMLWDRIARSYRPVDGTEPQALGVAGMAPPRLDGVCAWLRLKACAGTD